MATSTRKTFTASYDGPQITVEQRVSQSVARRALRQIEAAQQPSNAPALAAPGGLVQRPGGEPLRPRATQATGATPVGAAVQYNQGILTGTPLVGGAGAAPNLDMNRAILVEGDPNGGEDVPRITPRSRVDWAINTVDSSTWYWANETSEWLLTVGGTAVVVDSAAPGAPPDNPKTIWVRREPAQAFVWDAEAATPAWLGPIGGGGIIYGDGDPSLDLELEWRAQAQFYDMVLGRMFVAGPPESPFWLPTGPYSFEPSSYALATTFYTGDTYQASDGAFYRLNSLGQWVLQWFCPDCVEEPEPGPPDGCNPGYSGWNLDSGALSQWGKCS